MPLLGRVTQSFLSKEGLRSRLQSDRNHLALFSSIITHLSVVLLNGQFSWCGKQQQQKFNGLALVMNTFCFPGSFKHNFPVLRELEATFKLILILSAWFCSGFHPFQSHMIS